MNKLSTRTIMPLFFAIFLSIANSYAQSENDKINTLIEQKKAFNKTNKNIIVFKIQIYNGNETQAYAVQRSFEADFPEYRAKIKYDTPEFKTRFGNFRTRLEADRALNAIKVKYAGAIVLEEKI
ncbi:MAG: SPOR domain-containing protein [Flavobacteriaceae bacterium]|nr:SPOR domain-containing protein [Flavobacteriaceae bacterium]